ncbi:MAG: transposase [Mediterranea sp.]|nr:transposase [Mediterranea sp.]
MFARISVSRTSGLLKEKSTGGCCASKRCWFYGFKVHMIVTSGGIPVEFTFTPGSKHDLDRLKQLPVNPLSVRVLKYSKNVF